MSRPDSTSQIMESPSESRRPYKRPELRRLGSVRELTLGSAGNAADGAGTRQSNAQGNPQGQGMGMM